MKAKPSVSLSESGSQSQSVSLGANVDGGGESDSDCDPDSDSDAEGCSPFSCVIRCATAHEKLLRKKTWVRHVGPGGPTGPGIEYFRGTGRRLAAGAHVGIPFSCVTICATAHEKLC